MIKKCEEKNRIKWLLFSIFFVIVVMASISIGSSVFSNTNHTSLTEEQKEQAYYLVQTTNQRKYRKSKHKFQLYDKNGNFLGEEVTTSKGDIYYSYYDRENQKFYCMGPGGFYQYDLSKLNLQKLSDDDVNKAFFDSQQQKLYYYINGGFTKDGTSYQSQICTSHDCITLDYPVRDFVLLNDHLYVLSNTGLFIYQQKQLIHTIPIDDANNLFLLNNLVYVMLPEGYYQIKENYQMHFIPYPNAETELYPLQTNHHDSLFLFQSHDPSFIYRFTIGKKNQPILERFTRTTYQDIGESIKVGELLEFDVNYGKNSFLFLNTIQKDQVKSYGIKLKIEKEDTVWKVVKLKEDESTKKTWK